MPPKPPISLRSTIQIDLGAMRFPNITVMERVGANPEPKSWSLVAKVSLDIAI